MQNEWANKVHMMIHSPFSVSMCSCSLERHEVTPETSKRLTIKRLHF